MTSLKRCTAISVTFVAFLAANLVSQEPRQYQQGSCSGGSCSHPHNRSGDDDSIELIPYGIPATDRRFKIERQPPTRLGPPPIAGRNSRGGSFRYPYQSQNPNFRASYDRFEQTFAYEDRSSRSPRDRQHGRCSGDCSHGVQDYRQNDDRSARPTPYDRIPEGFRPADLVPQLNRFSPYRERQLQTSRPSPRSPPLPPTYPRPFEDEAGRDHSQCEHCQHDYN